MTIDVLDNPIFAALDSRHRSLAGVAGPLLRYPPAFAPFAGVKNAGVDGADALASLVEPDETVFFLGVAPAQPEGWQLQPVAQLAQMICLQPIDAVDGPAIVALTAADRADVLALTALVYPHYFRARTMDLGRYFGIRQGGRLAAMIGERMATNTCQEISAVCTHPDFNGRGLARQLLAWLTNDILAQGRTPFLHVSQDNARAVALYQRSGYQLRRGIPFWSLRRGLPR